MEKNKKEIQLEEMIEKLIVPKYSMESYDVFVGNLFSRPTMRVQFRGLEGKDLFDLAKEMERLFVMLSLRDIQIHIFVEWGEVEIKAVEQ